MRAVTDAGPLVHLSWIAQLGLLSSLFDEIIVPAGVRDEVLRASSDVPGVDDLRNAFATSRFSVQQVVDVAAVQAFAATLDPGESEALVLMRESQADLLLADDRRARLQATRQGYRLTGTLGILRTARSRGLIPSAAVFLGELQHRGFRLSTELLDLVQREEA
jgi:predicted nucleic acid-binding protein